jgi:cytidyltransferase-like protein
MIFPDPHVLREHLKEGERIVCTSGGFDPLHIGHLRCILATGRIARERDAKCVVIVNGNGFLERKKGKPFMDELERAEIISAIRGVDHVVLWDDGSQFVSGCIDILQPIAFTKGGDRTCEGNVPEFALCSRIGCEVIFGVGGDKIQSSSSLIAGARE